MLLRHPHTRIHTLAEHSSSWGLDTTYPNPNHPN